MTMSLWEYCRARVANVSRFGAGTTVVTRSRGHRLLQSFLGDQSGSYVLVVALMMPVLVGSAGLGTEVVWWLYKQKDMQSAADSGAVNASGSNQLKLIKCNLYSNSNANPSLDVSGSAAVSANQVGVVGNISGASNITATNGIRTGMQPVADPYANVSPPPEPSCSNA